MATTSKKKNLDLKFKIHKILKRKKYRVIKCNYYGFLNKISQHEEKKK